MVVARVLASGTTTSTGATGGAENVIDLMVAPNQHIARLDECLSDGN